VQNGKIDLNDLVRVNIAVKPQLIVEDGDLLICVRNGSKALVGKAAIIRNLNEPMTFGAFMAIYRSRLNQFVELFMQSPIFREILEGISTTTINQITQSNLKATVIAIPPFAEQSRIVAKVQELMALCDALETRGKLEAEQHSRLTATLLDALAASESAHQLGENWARLASNLDLIVDRPEAVDVLEQSLLQLAVRGLLVNQDPNDEPASELLERIRAEKDRLIVEGKIKRGKPLPAISEDEKPFDLPQGWEWVRFGSVINSSEAGWSPSCDVTPRAGDCWGVLKVSAVSWGEFRSYENKALPIGLTPRPEIEVKAGDFLLSRANTEELVARSVVADNPEPRLMMSDKIIRLDLSSLVNRHFFNQVNNTTYSRAHYIEHASGTSSSMKNVSREVIMNLLVPLPPLAEQSRVVAGVEALRALCARLRERLTTSLKTQTHLAESLIESTTND
jgi:type I restriction enzyme S subunit